MTDLQMGLIGFGGVAVLGVLAYNKWQERKHRRMAEKLLGARQTDVLLDEPTSAAGAAASKDGAPRATQERVEPLLRSEPEEFQEPDEPTARPPTADDSGDPSHTAAAARTSPSVARSRLRRARRPRRPLPPRRRSPL
jgi:FtsZ-interacting cell division protein ZipA